MNDSLAILNATLYNWSWQNYMESMGIGIEEWKRWEDMLLLLLSRFSCVQLCDPTDGSPPGSSVPGILQARTLEWVAYFLLQCMKVKSESEVVQSCPTLCDPMACSLPGSSVHGIFQARVLEWVAIAFSKHEY